MTNKEAKTNLEKLLLLYDDGMIDFSVIRESVKVAIEALKCMSLNADIINADAMHKLFVTGEMTIEDFKKMCGKEIKHECDLISRQAAIDAVEFGITYAKVLNKETGEVTELFKSSNEELQKAVDRIEALPSAQSEKVTPHRNYKYLSDYWCECGNHLGKKGSVTFCSDCGRKVKWDE